MASDRVVINLDQRARKGGDGLLPGDGFAPSEDAMAQAFAERYGAECGYVGPGDRRVTWARKLWIQDSTGNVFALIRKFVRLAVSDTKDERSIATAAKVASATVGARLGPAAAA